MRLSIHDRAYCSHITQLSCIRSVGASNSDLGPRTEAVFEEKNLPQRVIGVSGKTP